MTAKNVTVVAIGASAGGLQAIQDFFDHTPQSTGLAFVVIQHLSPDYKSVMDELLSRHTKMRIYIAENNMPIKKNTVYLIPPKYNMTLSDENTLQLSEQNRKKTLNLPIDIFFNSMARIKKDQCIAVILSGTGSDGSKGIQAVSLAGGLVLVQSPSSAKFDGMPKSAISTGTLLKTITPMEMPNLILKHLQRTTPSLIELVQSKDQSKDIFNSDFKNLLKEAHKRHGLNLEEYKAGTIQRRVLRRMQTLSLDAMEEYIKVLKNDPREIDALINESLIGVTSFFRDPEAFSLVNKTIIPKIFKKNTEIRIWVCGCSNGAEAYSIAFLCEEYIREHTPSSTYKIFATDIIPQSIAFASTGIYPLSITQEIPDQSFITRYCSRHKNAIEINRDIKNKIIFTTQNILNDPPFTKMDLITCRNMLIYFHQPIQQEVIEKFSFGLSMNGYLLLGPSESLGKLHSAFSTISQKWNIFQKIKNVRLPSNTIQKTIKENHTYALKPYFQPLKKTERLSFSNQEYDTLLKELIPHGALINNDNEVTHIFGDARQLIDTPEGTYGSAITLSQIIKKELKITINTAIFRARKENQTQTFTNLKIQLENEDKFFNLSVQPLTSGRILLLVTDTDTDTDNKTDQKPIDTKELNIDSQTHFMINSLEKELQHTKDTLQLTVEAFESTNEELQSTNEELLASNEELQGTNEELQSVNEELYTLNAEHQEKIEHLNRLNNDIDNLLTSTDIATIFLDSDFNIRKFTPQVAKLFYIIESDIGRSIFNYSHEMSYPALREDIQNVMHNGCAINKRIFSRTKTPYLAKLNPYLTAGTTNGIVISFIDISPLVDLENKFLIAKKIAKLGHWSLALPSGQLEWSTQLRKIFDLSDNARPPSFKEHQIYVLEEDWPHFFTTTTSAIENQTPYSIYFRIQINGNLKYLHGEGIPQFDNRQNFLGFFGIIQDITSLKSTENQLRKQIQNFENLQESISDGYWDWHVQDDYEYMSPRFWEMFGYDPNTKKHHPSEWQKIIHPEDLAIALDNFEKHIKTLGAHPYRQDVRYYHNNGSIVWVHCQGKIIEWSDTGQPIRMIGSHTDITQIKQLQELYELVLKGISVGIWDWSNITDIKENWSDKFFELLGYQRGEIEPSLTSFKNLLHPDDQSRVFDLLTAHFENNVPFDLEYRLKTKSGQYKWFRGSGQVARDNMGNPVRMAGSIVDINDHKVAKEKLRNKQDLHTPTTPTTELSAVGKMAEKIHQTLNNPLLELKDDTQTLMHLAESGELGHERTLAFMKKLNDTLTRVSGIMDGLKLFSENSE